MGFFHSLYYVLLGVIAWTLPWVAVHATLARLFPGAYSDAGTPRETWALCAALLLSVALSLLAGFLTARLAHRHPLAHVAALALLQLVLAASIQAQHAAAMPRAYHIAFLGLLVPAHLVGGRVGARARRPGSGSAPHGPGARDRL